MPLWLLKFTPAWDFIKKHWKIVAAIVTFVSYTLFVMDIGYDRADTKWELYEAERIAAEQQAEILAQQNAEELRQAQQEAQDAREEELRKAKEEAEERAEQARAEAQEQRRLNNETTAKLVELQAADPTGPVPLSDGVRDLITDSQNKVRSLRQP